MTVEEAVRSVLVTLADLTALVGTRIYLDKLPQSPTYPCVRVSLVSEQTDYHFRGADALKPSRVQVDAYAREVSGVDPYALVIAVADAIDGDGTGSGLSGWFGNVGGSPSQGRILGIFRADRQRYYDPEELRVITMSQDYRVRYQAA